jgi:hypothetical protein
MSMMFYEAQRSGKLPPGANFTNILRTAFTYKSFAQSIFVLTFGFELFLAQEY